MHTPRLRGTREIRVIHRPRILFIVEEILRRKWAVSFVVLLAVAPAMVIGARQLLIAYQRVPTGLEYDGAREFRIANRLVTVETRSVSLGNGDDGDAEIIVSSSVKSTKLTSQFSDDMWTFIRPAYISWEDVDNHPGRDLLIWKPSFSTHGPLHAKEYISSEDGELHVLQVPLETPIPRH
jgi:hypothetical protein